MVVDKVNLLLKRVKVIAPYPHMKVEVGDILIQYFFKTSDTDMYCYCTNIEVPLQGRSINPEFAESMPHLFKPLQWWEERSIDDMPEYVKIINKAYHFSVQKVICFTDNKSFVKTKEWASFQNTEIFEPATLEDYNTYLSSSKNK